MNPNPVCIFGHQIKSESLKDDIEYWKYKKDSYSSKASLCVESYLMFFLPWPSYCQYQLGDNWETIFVQRHMQRLR